MSIRLDDQVAIVTGGGHAGGEAIANAANVANFEQVEEMVAAAMEKWGRVDILINNAGRIAPRPYGISCASKITVVLCSQPQAPDCMAISDSQTTVQPRWRWSG